MSRTALSLLALGLVACGPSTSDKAPVLDIGGLQGGMPGGGTIGAVFTTPGVKPGEELDPYVDENFITLISAAKSSVKLAVDRLDHPAMQEAVLEAWDRGLDVQVVGDSKNALDDGFQLLESAGVPVVIRPADVGVMNNKYAVVDDFVVWTGSLSPVTSDLLYNNNANIYLADEALASLYANDFKQMFVGQTFGGGKEQLAAGTAVNVGGAYGQVAFGGADPQLDVIIAEIESATSSIVIAARVLEHAGIVNALLQARASGIAVVVLLDYTAAESSLVWEEALLDGDIIVVRDGNENTMGDGGGSMGHQFMLIDGMEGSAGSSLIVSSGPWAQSGAETDDNNLLLLRDADIADRYAAELCDLLTAARPHPTRTGAPTPVDAFDAACSDPAPMVRINEVMADPTGTDAGKEYIEIVNTGSTPVDLSGWTLGDAANPARHTFAGTVLAVGGAVVVFDRGSHTGVPLAMNASTRVLALNNSGDTVILTDATGATHDLMTYGRATTGVSFNRNPDGDPSGMWVQHDAVDGAQGRKSPGLRVDGTSW